MGFSCGFCAMGGFIAHNRIAVSKNTTAAMANLLSSVFCTRAYTFSLSDFSADVSTSPPLTPDVSLHCSTMRLSVGWIAARAARCPNRRPASEMPVACAVAGYVLVCGVLFILF